jgi:glycosyltransferase involved in cell wall biosynthesis
MKIAFLSVSHNFYGDTKNSLDIAIGRYVKHTLEAMRSQISKEDEITLVTNKEGEGQANAQYYKVKQPFNKSLGIGWQLWRFFQKEKFDVIHFQHEFFIYGGVMKSLLITLALLLTRGSRVIITAHHVIDIDKIDQKFIIENNYNFPVWIVRSGLRLSYALLFASADAVIVHEDESKEILLRNWQKTFSSLKNKLTVVPHGIGKREKISMDIAKNKLKLRQDYYHVLFFGYVSRHKGLGLLVDAIQKLQDKGEKISLIVAGGEHPKLSKDKDYVNFYSGLKNKTSTFKDACWYGFAQEEELVDLFSAANLAAFPYTTRNATSGSVTDSISFAVPFILSDKFENIRQFRDLIFKTTADDLSEKILSMKQKDISADLVQWQKEFSWETSCKQQYELYRGTQTN